MVCEEVEQFCKRSFNQSLVGTFLCILHEINNEEIDGTHSLVLDILADGVLLVLKINLSKFSLFQNKHGIVVFSEINFKRIVQLLILVFSAHAPVNTSVFSIRTLVFRKNCLRIPLKMDDANPSLSNKKFLEIAGPISPERMCIYNQISKSYKFLKNYLS